MEFFGLTKYGSSDPIKFYMRSDYKEPITPPNLLEMINKGQLKRPIYEAIRELDVYSGILDGFPYRSVHREVQHKKKGFHKPVEPFEMFREPITTSMEYGWCLQDPELKKETWYKADERHPQPTSERTRFFNKALLVNKHFTL